MNKTVDGGKTFLVDGPASVLVVSGVVEVFGYSPKNTNLIVIREGKRLPFVVKEKASFDFTLGEGAKTQEVDGNTIPASWAEGFEVLRSLQKKPVVVMVVGGVDLGKSSLCTYLINRTLSEKRTVAILDGDMGQSEIGPPCTVAYALVTEPVTDLCELKAEKTAFVGVTSPSEDTNTTIRGITKLKADALANNVDFVVVNTDGWVLGEQAIDYKLQLTKKLAPDMIFYVEQNSELQPLLIKLENFKTLKIDSAVAVKERNKEKRKQLRELCYRKYLADAKTKTLHLNLVNIDGSCLRWLKQNPQHSQGLLLGLHDSKDMFLGIGVLQGIDYQKRTLKILTSVTTIPAQVSLGRVRLDRKLREL